MTELRFEAWTLPTSPSFEKRFDITDVLAGTGVVEPSAYTDQSITVPATYPKLSDLVSPTDGTLIGVYLGDHLIDEFLAERVPKTMDRPDELEVSGKQVNGLVEWCAIYPYRYPDDSPGAQDWHWGHEQNLVRNGSGEDNPLGIANPGFESGLLHPWWAGAVDGVHATATVDDSDPDEGTYHAVVEALAEEGGFSTSVRVVPDRTYQFGARVRTDAGTDDWQAGASGPEAIQAGPGAVVREFTGSFAGTFEAQVEDTVSDSYQDLELEFTAAPDQTSSQISIRYWGSAPPKKLFVDKIRFTGFGVGVDGWGYTGGVSDFQVAQDVTPTDGDWHFRVAAEPNDGVFQGITGFHPKETVTVEVDMAGPVARLWTVELRDLRGNVILQIPVTLAGSLTTYVGTAVLPDVIPGGEGTVEVWLVNRHNATSILYYDNVKVYTGQPASTATVILRQLIEAAQARGTFTFVDLDFTDTHDTGTTALTPISMSAFFGENGHLGQVTDVLRAMGYTWRLKRKASPGGGKTHDLQLWAPNTVPQDHTASPGGPSILAGAHVTQAETVSRIPPFTTLLGHGAGSLRLEQTNTATEAVMGRIERVIDAENITSETSLQGLLNARFGDESENREALTATVLATAQSVPGVDYDAGDVVWWQFPGITDKRAKQVRRFSWNHAPIASFEVQGSKILTPDAALVGAVDELLREQRRRRGVDRLMGRQGTTTVVRTPAEPPTSGGGVSVGARIHASAGSQSIDSGGEVIVWDTEEIPNLGFGTVGYPVTEFEIRVAGYYNVDIALAWDTWDEGGTVEVVRTRASVPEVVWPLATHPDGLWTATDGEVFEGSAPAIPCLPGDLISVTVDHGDGSAKDLATATLAVYKVESETLPIIEPPEPVWVFTEPGCVDWDADAAGVTHVDVWIIGGGGSSEARGAINPSGGGGAGRLVTLTNYPVSGLIQVCVGAGGVGGLAPTKGEDSSFDGQTAEGGGVGVNTYDSSADGGSGGGGSGGGTGGTGGPNTPGTGISPGGNDGGAGFITGAAGNNTRRAGGGGGGAGAPGEDAADEHGGDGGIGVDLSHIVGTAYGDNGWFCGGGGGYTFHNPGVGGQGGGGDAEQPGMPNTGGGAGGAGDNPVDGGSGIVIVRRAA